MQAIQSQGKCTQGLAKRSRKKTQVFNLPLLAIPFDRGLRVNARVIVFSV